MDRLLPCVVIVLLNCGLQTEASNILLIPTTHYSHVNVFAIAARALQDDGHDVTLLVVDEYASRAAKQKVPMITFPFPPGGDFHKALQPDTDPIKSFSQGLNILSEMMTALEKTCNAVLRSMELMDKIESKQFDLAIVDSVPATACFLVIPHRLGIPHALLGPWLDPWVHGLPVIPSHEPHLMLAIHGHLTFIQRVQNLLAYIFVNRYGHVATAGNEIVAQYAPGKPQKTLRQLAEDSSITLITQEIHAFSHPRISAPNYRFIGSLGGREPSKPLEGEFKEFVDGAEGLIVVSFGSIKELQDMARPHIGKLLAALSRVEQHVIFQYDSAVVEGLQMPKNILIKKWLPQNDLLGHNKTVLFIAHGGLNGHLEGTHHGVPILTLPFQPEQIGNGNRAKALKHGDILNWVETTEEDFYKTIMELISNPVYKTNVRKCAEILKYVPDSKKELVFWINHVLRFGNQHLRLLAADMPWWQFWMIDVFAFFLLIDIALVSFCVFLIRCCCCRSKTKAKKD